MNKIAIVFWSGTGNTEAMADAVAAGINEQGGQATIIQASSFSSEQMDSYDAIAFGCPSMGEEELEETEFAPMFSACKSKLHGKKIALFGSYGWGDGEWMRTWEETCISEGANLVTDSVICNEAPDDEAIAACKELGAALLA